MKQLLFSIAQNIKKVNSPLSLSLSLSSRIISKLHTKSASLWRLFVSKTNTHLERSEPQSSQATAHATTPFSLPKAHSPSPAFTIVELLIVIVIIAILAAITIISYNGITTRARSSALSSSLQSGAKKAATYALQNSNTLPADLTAFLTAAGYSNSGNTTYQYTANTATTPALFCITATQDSTTYHIAGNADGAVNKVVQGPCTGHTGTAPTKLADGSSCPTGYIVVPGSSNYNQDSFCAMKYEAKNDGSGNAISQAAGTPWASINWNDVKTKAAAIGGGYHLMTESEWMTIAANVLSVGSNWSTGTVGSGYIYSGHNDSAPGNVLAADANDANGYSGETNTGGNQRRTLTLTNGQVIWDFAGNVWEWTDQTITGKQPGLTTSDTGTWKEWTNSSLAMNGLGQLSRPGSISAAAKNWNSGNNIGQLWSNPGDTRTLVFIRGGAWYNGGGAGVTMLSLSVTPSYVDSAVGWRAAR